MRAGLTDIEQREEICCLPRTCQHTCRTALQRRDLGRHVIVCRVLQSCIEIAGSFQIKEFPHILAGIVFEGCRLNDRDFPRLPVPRAIACLHTFGSDVLIFHLFSLLYTFYACYANYARYALCCISALTYS